MILEPRQKIGMIHTTSLCLKTRLIVSECDRKTDCQKCCKNRKKHGIQKIEYRLILADVVTILFVCVSKTGRGLDTGGRSIIRKSLLAVVIDR